MTPTPPASARKHVKFPAPGDMFEDAYQIDSVLGSGGFARVYRATEKGLERPVALKILRPPVRDHEDDAAREDYLETLMKRFQREALLLSRLKSPYTVTMLQYGKTSDGLLYMVLEFVDGQSLAEVSREGAPLEPARVVRILRQVLESLHEAHTMGMLHRDLKPANIMIYEHLGEADRVKLLDFGIAKTVSDVAGPKKDLTSDGTLIGTPRYMAPEQIQGEDIGPASDIYALGLVAYELIVGERAITEDSSIQIIGQQMSPRSFQIPEYVTAPRGLRALVNKMINKSLSHRYQSAKEVLEDLKNPDLLDDSREFENLDDTQRAIPHSLVEDASKELLEKEQHQLQPQIDPSQQDNSWEVPPQKSRSTLIALIGIGLVGLLLLALIVINVSSDGPEAATKIQQDPTAIFEPDTGTESENEPIALNFEEDDDAGKKLEPVMVSSNRDGVTIELDGKTLGKTPVEIPRDKLPAMVVARWNQLEQEVEISLDSEPVNVEFDEPRAESADSQNSKKESETETKPEPRRERVEREVYRPRRRPPRTRAKPDPKPDPRPSNPYLPID